MRVVVALGGNAMLKRGEPMTADVQRANIQVAAAALAPVAMAHELVLSHGNGPQVGLPALQAAAYEEVDAYPLDVLGAQTEGMIGYMIEQELGNLLPFEVPLATIITMVEVDPDDAGARRARRAARALVRRRFDGAQGRRRRPLRRAHAASERRSGRWPMSKRSSPAAPAPR